MAVDLTEISSNGASARAHQPTVVFVDDAPWECFFHLSAMLRRNGFRTVRISIGLPDWQGDHMLFDRQVSLPAAPTSAHLAKILSTEWVSDIHPTEHLASTTYAAMSLLPVEQRSDVWRGRTNFLDKLRVSADVRALGLRAPDTLLAGTVTPREAVDELSLPIVLKPRVSSAGGGIQIFESLAALESFVATLSSAGDWFYERYVDGRPLVCGACVSNDGIDVITSYLILERVDAHGSSLAVEILDDAVLEGIGARLIEGLAIRGLVCFDVIRDPHGVDWIHDINLRDFGGVSMCQLVGFDFVGSYVRWLTGRGSIAPAPVGVAGQKQYVFPFGLEHILRSSPQSSAPIRTIRWALSYQKLLGTRYFLSVALRAGDAVFRRFLTRASDAIRA